MRTTDSIWSGERERERDHAHMGEQEIGRLTEREKCDTEPQVHLDTM